MDLVGSEPTLGLPLEPVKKKFNDWMHKEYNIRWCMVQGIRWHGTSSLDRTAEEEKVWSQELVPEQAQSPSCWPGHNSVGRYFHLIRLTEDPACRFCARRGKESSLHLLCHCDALARHEFEFRVSQSSPEEIRETTLGKILSSARIGLMWDCGWDTGAQRAKSRDTSLQWSIYLSSYIFTPA